MKRFKSILYVVESPAEAPKISEKVQMLARHNSAKVHIAVLQEPMPSHFVGTPHFLEKMEDLRQHFKEEHKQFLEKIMSDEQWSNIDVSGSLVDGIGFIEIVKCALRENHDLVVIEEPTLTRIRINQLAMKLIRKCPCPVWIIRSQPRVEIKNILAAVNVQLNQEHITLNKNIIQLARSLAERENGEVHYLHAYHLQFEKTLSGNSFNLSSSQIDTLKKEVSGNSRKLMQQAISAAGFQANDDQILLKEGEPSQVIQQTIDELSVDTLIMGSLSQSGIPGFLIGRKAEQILSEIQCSVLTVKPDNFICPISL